MKETNLKFEIRFYEGVLEHKPDFIQALMALADCYTRDGQHEKGLVLDKQLSQLRPEDPYILYNLSCSYSLLNQVDKAFETMKLAIDGGYDDFRFLAKDQDLENLRNDQRFREYLLQFKNKRVFDQNPDLKTHP